MEWDKEKLQRLIDDREEESLTLEYKAADALGKSSEKKREVSKDVSAMANSAGGVIIYGIREYDDEGRQHLPEKIDGIERAEYSKEWLEQVINSNIQRRIENVIIHPVSVSGDEGKGVYVVEIPQSTTAHQAKDYRYYKRFNFESVPMEDYEIRDVMNRATTPNLEIDISTNRLGTTRDPDLTYHLELVVKLKNSGSLVVNHSKLEMSFPELQSYYPKWIPVGQTEKRAIGEVALNIYRNDIVDKFTDNAKYYLTYQPDGVIFPNEEIDLRRFFRLRFQLNIMDILHGDMNLFLEWHLYADNMLPKTARIALQELSN